MRSLFPFSFLKVISLFPSICSSSKKETIMHEQLTPLFTWVHCSYWLHDKIQTHDIQGPLKSTLNLHLQPSLPSTTYHTHHTMSIFLPLHEDTTTFHNYFLLCMLLFLTKTYLFTWETPAKLSSPGSNFYLRHKAILNFPS